MEEYIKNKFIIEDLKEIETILNSEIKDEKIIKKLHKKLDGKYQSCIKDWGKSMYGWIENHGFSYEYLDSSSLIENIESMYYKISGLAMNLNGPVNSLQPVIETKKSTEIPKEKSKKVFIVHGRNNEKKIELSNFLHELGLEPIILHKQVNNGQTIIEKIENNSEVDCAIILLTPDDEGRLKESNSELKTRARQNVIFEAGFFMGKLGRKKTILISGVEETMSDIEGIVYLDINNYELDLLKELKSIGLIN